MLKIKICKDYQDLSIEAAGCIADYIKQRPWALISPAAGNSPTGTYRRLVELSQAGEVDFTGCKFVGLDEWVGMDKDDDGSCGHYLYKHFFEPLQIKEEKIIFFNGRADDLEAECGRIDRYISINGPIDLMIVGLGINGHIGLNEPGVSFDKYSHVTELTPQTIKVGQKYFKEETRIEKGITLGIKHVMEADTVIMLVSGKHKAGTVKKMIRGKTTSYLPASILQKHENCLLYLDREAASKL